MDLGEPARRAILIAYARHGIVVDEKKITCWYCEIEIKQYYNEAYKGRRGKCPACKTDFPLE